MTVDRVVSKKNQSGSLIKIWEEGYTPKVNVITNIGDYLSLSSVKRKMNFANEVIVETEQFWQTVEKQNGSFHYFKKQTFGPAYPRMVIIYIIILLN